MALISWRVMVGLVMVAVPWAPPREPVDAVPMADDPVVPMAVDEGKRKAAERFSGEYAFVGGDAERAARDAAIEDVVAEMNLLAQPIARSKLRDGNEIADRLEISIEGDGISVAFDGRPYVASLDGSKKRIVGIQGDELDYHIEIGGKHIKQVFKGDRGGRSNAFRRSGGKVAIDVKVTSGKLPKPLQYRLTYAPR